MTFGAVRTQLTLVLVPGIVVVVRSAPSGVLLLASSRILIYRWYFQQSYCTMQ
jgi:hypothetical protein